MIVSDDQPRFACAIEALKLTIPKKNRRYQAEGRYWFVDKRAASKLRRWLDSVKQAGETKVVGFDKSKSVIPDEAA